MDLVCIVVWWGSFKENQTHAVWHVFFNLIFRALYCMDQRGVSKGSLCICEYCTSCVSYTVYIYVYIYIRKKEAFLSFLLSSLSVYFGFFTVWVCRLIFWVVKRHDFDLSGRWSLISAHVVFTLFIKFLMLFIAFLSFLLESSPISFSTCSLYPHQTHTPIMLVEVNIYFCFIFVIISWLHFSVNFKIIGHNSLSLSLPSLPSLSIFLSLSLPSFNL